MKIFQSRVKIAKMALIDFEIARFVSPLLKLLAIVRASHVGIT